MFNILAAAAYRADPECKLISCNCTPLRPTSTPAPRHYHQTLPHFCIKLFMRTATLVLLVLSKVLSSIFFILAFKLTSQMVIQYKNSRNSCKYHYTNSFNGFAGFDQFCCWYKLPLKNTYMKNTIQNLTRF